MALGYLFLIISILAGAIKGFCGKKTSEIVKSTLNVTLLTCIRMFLCVLIGFFVVLIASQGFSGFAIGGQELLICVFSAFSSAFFVITWTIAIRKSAYTMMSIFTILSTLIPILICHFIPTWNEDISLFKIIGFCILFISVVFMWIYNNKVKGKIKFRDVLLLLLCGIFNGCSLFAQKWRFYECKDSLSAFTFNFYTYLFALVFLLIFFLITKLINKEQNKEVEKFPLKRLSIYLLVLSSCLFLNSLFSTFAAERLVSAIVFPLSNGIGLVLALLMGHFFFNEKIDKYSLIGIIIALISFVFMVL